MRGVLSLDLVLAVLFLFYMFQIADTFATSVTSYAESLISKPSCLAVSSAAALSYATSRDVFGPTAAVYYDYGKVDPDTYSVSILGADVNTVVYGLEGNYSCVVRIS